MKLKSCPFCESTDVETYGAFVELEKKEVDGWACYCNSCGARGPVKLTERKAANSWGQRPVEDRLREEMTFYQDACRGL